MTKKNGEIEFIWDFQKGQSRMIFNPETGNTIKFNIKSKRFFTANPVDIKFLEKMGYSALTVKDGGVKFVIEEPEEIEEKVEIGEKAEPEEKVEPKKQTRTKKKRV